ncbi:MAG: winged helix-turn-helix transcriptional regulator [Chloroflexia bacterium]|nr:winged helix-turn-helix transcriptional regulator [Chloroflexia bacterium]MDQ3514250.1 metalloregulator ArsR/SmtB family transcription factor [Chloroflexota bacterium]
MVAIFEDVAVDRVVETFKFLGDRNRLRILAVLSRSETCVCDLIDELELAQPLVSYHLAKLRKAGLVQARRDAQWVYYSLDPDAWERLTVPVAGFLHLASLPPEAAFGASRRCDSVPPDVVLGACAEDDVDCC